MTKDIFFTDKTYTFQGAVRLLARVVLSINDEDPDRKGHNVYSQ